MKIFVAAIALTVAYGLYGCGSTDTVDSKDVKEETIFRSYHLSYDEADKSLYQSAQFRVGGVTGTTIRLNAPSLIKISGLELTLNDAENSVARTMFTGTYYSRRLDETALPASYVFQWTKSESMVVDDEVMVATPVRVTSLQSGSRISRSQPIEVATDTTIKEPKETIAATLASKVDRRAPILVELTSVGSSVRFKQEDLAKLPVGPASLTIEHRNYRKLPEHSGDRGGVASSAYTTAPLEVVIGE